MTITKSATYAEQLETILLMHCQPSHRQLLDKKTKHLRCRYCLGYIYIHEHYRLHMLHMSRLLEWELSSQGYSGLLFQPTSSKL